MRLEPLSRIRFAYPELGGRSRRRLGAAPPTAPRDRCEGRISGRFRGANFPRRRTAAGPFRPDFRAVIETDDEATIMFECHGYGRAYPR